MKVFKINKQKSFTVVEFLVVFSVLAVLIIISAGAFILFQRKSDLNYGTEEIINVLRIAQNKTLASEGTSQYGVYFDNITVPSQYTLFKGSDYASREISFDKVYKLSEKVEIYAINLGGGNEVVFERLTGNSNLSGDLSLRLKTDPTNSQIIYIEASGQISMSSPAVPSDDDRIKDSRHLHFDYSRAIDTATETLTLDFGTKTENILITDNMKDGQIYWQGEIDVDGETQELKIHTHRLNNPDTQFCIHRDRRYNSKALTITISGDGSGALIDYSVDGSIISSTSIYVSNIDWQ